jgi:hypothetical protein
MIQLAQAKNGNLVLASDEEFPSDIARVEYYRDLKLFMLAFENENHENRLMPREISDDIASIVKKSPDIIVAIKVEGVEPYGYITPLVQIGL